MSDPDAPVMGSLALSWTVARADEIRRVSTGLPQPVEGPRFEPVDMLTARGSSADMYAPVRDAVAQIPPGRFVTMTGFQLFTDLDSPPLSFTLSIQLVEEDGEPVTPSPGQKLDGFEMACGRGVRLQELRQMPAGPLGIVPIFTAIYVARTEHHGTLLAEFGTPHVDAAVVFSQMFDAIAAAFEVS